MMRSRGNQSECPVDAPPPLKKHHNPNHNWRQLLVRPSVLNVINVWTAPEQQEHDLTLLTVSLWSYHNIHVESAAQMTVINVFQHVVQK